MDHLGIEPSSELASSLAKVTKSIRGLFLSEFAHSNRDFVRNILQLSPSLRMLNVCGCIINDEVCSLISEFHPDLSKLDLIRTSIHPASLRRMLQGFTRLTSFELTYGVVTSAGMLDIAYHCPHLVSFAYIENSFGDPPPVYQAKTLTCEALTVICSMCTHLKHLFINYDWAARHTMSMVFSAIAQRLPLLQTLHMRHVIITDNRGLELLLDSLHDLQQLCTGADGLSNVGFIRLLYQHPTLRNLSLYQTTMPPNFEITGINAAQIPLQPNRLRRLELSRFAALTDYGMHCILRACHKVHTLTVSGAPMINPEFVIPLILELCSRMKNVCFDGCMRFTQAKVNGILIMLGGNLNIGVNTPYQFTQIDRSDEIDSN